MSYSNTVRQMSDDELLEEYDWTARDRPVNEHEAHVKSWKMERMYNELMKRGLQW